MLVLLTLSKTSFADLIISDDFSKESLNQYDQSHIYFCNFNCGSYKSYQFLKEDNGNKFIRLTSRSGQLSHFNRGQKKYLKDRIELGTKSNKLSKSWSDLDDKEIWWSFDVKLPKNFIETNFEKFTENLSAGTVVEAEVVSISDTGVYMKTQNNITASLKLLQKELKSILEDNNLKVLQKIKCTIKTIDKKNYQVVCSLQNDSK